MTKKSEDNGENGGITRRRFLKGAGLTALSMANLDKGQAATQSQVLGPGHIPLSLKVNDVVHNLQIEPCETLAQTLRFELGLTGTKVSCDRGTCSACTVWLDRTPVCACMALTVDVGNRAVTTIEGLADKDELHPVQQAFIDKDATMCGFCTPGMIMSCAALLMHNSAPTLEDVRQATSGNFCRCGTYPKVFEATLAAAGVEGVARTKGSTPRSD